jgi:hypothetical protein
MGLEERRRGKKIVLGFSIRLELCAIICLLLSVLQRRRVLLTEGS